MPKTKLIVVHPALAPYRVDIFNALGQIFELRVLFLNRNVGNQQFDQNYLQSQLRCKYEYQQGTANVLGRTVPTHTHLVRNVFQFNPDLIVLSEFSIISLCLLVASVAIGRCRAVIWTDNNVHMCRRPSLARKLAESLAFHLCRNLGMIVQSDAVKKWYCARGVESRNIAVCPIIHNENRFRQALLRSIPAAEKYVKRERLTGKRIFLYVGRLAPEKNVDSLIRSFTMIEGTCRNTILVIVGGGKMIKRLRKLAAARSLDGKIRFLGHLEKEELLAWYVLASVFILPSYYEPYGVVVNEALLAGIPVLCSSMAGSSVLIQDGQNGLVFEPNNINDLADKMSRMIGESFPIRGERITLRKNLMPLSFMAAINGFVDIVAHMSKA